MASSIPGTNTPPISFPGIASGIDYNSIISKLTSLTLAPTVQLNAQIATLNAANLELIKINNMLASVQNSLTALSQSNLYNAYTGTSSAPSVATAQGIPNVSATPGTYTITQTQLATATQIFSNPNAGHKETDLINSPAVGSDTVPLSQSYAAITPSNGSGATGKVTINGVSVSYDVGSQSIQTIMANIQSAVRAATGDNTFTVGFAAGTDRVQITDANNPISLGSSGDSGNLLTVMRLDQAQINNTGTTGSVTATAGVGGVNQVQLLNSTNSSGYATSGNFLTPVTAGTFTINGVSISVDPTKDALVDVLNRINSSNAGVIASYNQATGQISLSNKATGAQGIVVGSGSDTSNFLSAAGLTSASGATTTLGTQAKVVLQTPSGGTQTVYSSSNTVTTAIPGLQLNLLANTTTPFSVTVSQDSTQLVSALNTFASAYNTAINEINQATAPPVISQSSTPGAQASQQVAGGILWGNADIQNVKDQLTNIVGGLVPSAGTSYNSLASIGLQLDSSYTVVSSSTTGSSTTPTLGTQTIDGTSGQLQPLNLTTLQAALVANPSAVQNIFNSAQGVLTQMGTYLTGVTGLPTNVSTGLLGTIPSISLMQMYENTNTDNITSINQQIQVIQNSANMQADQLRAEFSATESQLAGYQALQQQLGSFFKPSTGG